MSAFKTLRDVSHSFEQDLRQFSDELFTTTIVQSFEDLVAKKLKDLSLYTSKLRLLQAKFPSGSPPTAAHTDEQTTISSYAEAVKWKLVEQQTVKAVTQSHHVKALITTADSSLDPEMLERKEKIIEQLKKFREKEMQLRQLDTVLKERQQHLEKVRQEWDEQLGVLTKRKATVNEINLEEDMNPLFNKLHRLEGKLSTLRALLARLASARGGGYDWLADPHCRLRALQLARQ